ncbi:hypothetical protein H0W80_02540 [Candidatus Saccharibacteria bacterium]|nr:hypothetical protein [Candidatus Saccharibacteria bacterium]
MRFSFGTYDIEVQIKTKVSKSHRPVVNRWPWLQQWTQWKCYALLQITVGIMMVSLTIMTLRGHESSMPVLQSALLSMQVLGAPYMFNRHKQEIAWREEHLQ